MALALVVYLGSLAFFVRHYGKDVVAEVGNGAVALYWGGDPDERNSYVYNAGEWPLEPETRFAGSDPGGMEWEIYSPSLTLSAIWWEGRPLWRTVGLGWPRFVRDVAGPTPEARSLRLPLAVPAGLALLLGLVLTVRRYRRGGSPAPHAFAVSPRSP